MIQRIVGAVVRLARAVVWELHWGIPGGPGRPDPWAELDDLEAMRRREREVWRQGTDEEPEPPHQGASR